MKAKCQTCKKHWNVSWMQYIPKSGYECPACYSKRKKALRPANLSSHKENNLHSNYSGN